MNRFFIFHRQTSSYETYFTEKRKKKHVHTSKIKNKVQTKQEKEQEEQFSPEIKMVNGGDPEWQVRDESWK